MGPLGKNGIEGGERLEPVGMERIGGQVNLCGLVQGRVAQENRASAAGGVQARVASRQARQYAGPVTLDQIELLFSSLQAQRQQATVR